MKSKVSEFLTRVYKRNAEYIKEQESKPDLKEEVKKFFKSNPYPEDSKVHSFADKLGVNPHELETAIYSVLSDLLKETN